jgi:hypothetical protein
MPRPVSRGKFKSVRRDGVYVLRLNKRGDNGRACFYVGKSVDVEGKVAFLQSRECNVAWVKEHGGVKHPVNTIVTEGNLDTRETEETVIRMITAGLSNVRGAEWTSTAPLTRSERHRVRAVALSLGDLCTKCGSQTVHSAEDCTRPKADWLLECEEEDTESDDGMVPVAKAVKVAETLVAKETPRKPQRANTKRARLYEVDEPDDSDSDTSDESYTE